MLISVNLILFNIYNILLTSLLGPGKHLYRNNIFNPLIFQSSTTSGITNGKQETVKIIRLLNYNRDMKKVCFFFLQKKLIPLMQFIEFW